jgi:hypothetical protein
VRILEFPLHVVGILTRSRAIGRESQSPIRELAIGIDLRAGFNSWSRVRTSSFGLVGDAKQEMPIHQVKRWKNDNGWR